jgi:energy-converting hydrogenase Eha subunit H
VYESIPAGALLLMEVAGMAFVCGVALVEAVTAGALYALFVVLWGLLIALWALVTRVRRRLQAGTAIASLGLFLLIAVPVAQLVPHMSGVALWAALAGAGALSLLIATTLEQSRVRVGAALRRLSELTEVWE